MRELLLTVLFSQFLFQTILAQDDNLVYSITFAGCFDNNKVALKLNGLAIIEPTFVNSNPVLSITNVGVFQNKKGMWLSSVDKKQRLPPISVSDSLSISIFLNGTWNDFKVDLRNGKTMLINACFEQLKGKNKSKVTVDQHNETVLLD